MPADYSFGYCLAGAKFDLEKVCCITIMAFKPHVKPVEQPRNYVTVIQGWQFLMVSYLCNA